jgi:hypothetical protein
MPHTQSIWQHSRAYILALSVSSYFWWAMNRLTQLQAFMGIFMFGYDTVGYKLLPRVSEEDSR